MKKYIKPETTVEDFELETFMSAMSITGTVDGNIGAKRRNGEDWDDFASEKGNDWGNTW